MYIYIFSNTERPDLVKIGRTNGNPRERARKLTNETGAIGQYVVEWFMEVPDNSLAEQIIHFRLKQYHYEKEFYKVSIAEAIWAASVELDKFFQIEHPKFFVRDTSIYDMDENGVIAAIGALELLLDDSDESLVNDAKLAIEALKNRDLTVRKKFLSSKFMNK